MTGGEAGFIRFRAFADADKADSGGFREFNPLADPLTLDVDEINLTFYTAGSNRIIARCHYTPDLDDVIFQSVPDND